MKSTINQPIIRRNGLIAELRRATRKSHDCKQCREIIHQGTEYYSVIIGGGGLGSIKRPDYVHPDCVNAFLDYNYGRGDR